MSWTATHKWRMDCWRRATVGGPRGACLMTSLPRDAEPLHFLLLTLRRRLRSRCLATLSFVFYNTIHALCNEAHSHGFHFAATYVAYNTIFHSMGHLNFWKNCIKEVRVRPRRRQKREKGLYSDFLYLQQNVGISHPACTEMHFCVRI